MRISKLVKIVTLAFIALSSVAIVTTFLSSRAVTNMGKAYETQSQFNQLGLQLQNASDLLTQQAQAYVQYGEKKYYDAYWYEINTDKNRDKAIQELTNLGAPKNEMDLVVKAGQLSNTLAELESRAFDEVEKGNLDEARKLMFGDLYEQGKMPIITTMDEFQSTMNSRTQDDALRAKNLAKTYSAVSLISVISAVLVGVMGLIFMYVKITPINKIVEMANQISDGNMNVNFLPKSKDEIGDLSESFEKVCRVVNSLINDISKLATNQAMGEIDYFVNETTYSGSYKILVSEVNAMCKNSYGDLMSIIDNITHIANGDFNADIKKLPGKKAIASENLNIMRENLKSVAKDIKSLVNDATIGELSNRTDIRKYSGDWADLLNSLNQLMEAIAAPIYESAEVLHQVSVGNFDYKVCGAYKGDFLLIKNSINNTITNVDSYIADISSTLGALSNDDLSQEITREYVGKYSEIKYAINNIIDKFSSIISEIFKAADHIASGARNISEGSTILAQGASEQASSVEELNATIMTINENTMMTAQDSKIAKDLSVASQNSADEGNRDMKNMLTSMEKIKDSTQNIAKIITVIDDIAFQTNLLALNAAVEAARAGEHGKGFAVVAEEVRSLASRSQNSAKETSELIAESITNVNDGSKMAATTATALNTITSYTTKISDIIKDIATASAQQAEAIGHVTIGITQIAGVVQNNSATSEESASTSQQLSCQSEVLKNLVSRFKLKSSQL